MRLISYRRHGADWLGVVGPDGDLRSSAALGDGLPSSMAELLAAGDAAVDALRAASASAAASGAPADVDPAEVIAPVPRPGKVVAVGLNYHAHAAEGGAAIPANPMLFAKFPTAVIGPGATVEWDPGLTAAVDLEAELGVVIGRTARRVSEGRALDHVLGYTCVNDVSARDLQFADRQFVRAKSLDTFCPMGPVLVTRDEITDPGQLCRTQLPQRRAHAGRPHLATSSSASPSSWPSARGPSRWSRATSSPRARPPAWAGTATPRCSCATATS